MKKCDDGTPERAAGAFGKARPAKAGGADPLLPELKAGAAMY